MPPRILSGKLNTPGQDGSQPGARRTDLPLARPGETVLLITVKPARFPRNEYVAKLIAGAVDRCEVTEPGGITIDARTRHAAENTF